MTKKYIRVLLPDSFGDRKHHNTRNWKNIIYYSERKKVKARGVVNDYQRCGSYQRDTFYKVQGLSRDPIWDFYRILKPFKSKNIGVKVNNNNFKGEVPPPLTITRYPKDQPCVISFD